MFSIPCMNDGRRLSPFIQKSGKKRSKHKRKKRYEESESSDRSDTEDTVSNEQGVLLDTFMFLTTIS